MRVAHCLAEHLKKGDKIVLTPTAAHKTAADNPLTIAEIIEVVRNGQDLVIKIKVATADGKFTTDEIVVAANQIVQYLTDLHRLGFFGRLWLSILNLFNSIK